MYDDAPPASDADRGLSPVIGVGLLVAIVVTLSAVTLFMLGGLTEQTNPAPQAALDLQPVEDEVGHELVHQGGDNLGERDGQIVVRGVADPDVLDDGNLSADRSVTVYPVEGTVEIVWFAEESDESYVLDSFEADPVPAAPDEGCEWVEAETNGGSDDLTVDGITVACDLETSGSVTVKGGGTVIGDVEGGDIDFDNGSTIYGTVDASKGVDVSNASIMASIDADGDVDIDEGSAIDGDATGTNVDISKATVKGTVDADGGVTSSKATVDGDLVGAGDIDLDGSTVRGQAYAGSDFDCSGSTVDGEDCSTADYSPRDHGDH